MYVMSLPVFSSRSSSSPLACPALIEMQTRETDVDNDGLPDVLQVDVSMPLQPSEQITSCSLVLFFDFQLHVRGYKYPLSFFFLPIHFLFAYQYQTADRPHRQEYVDLQMESAVVIQYESASPGAALTTAGHLRFQQEGPLPHDGSRTVYNVCGLASVKRREGAIMLLVWMARCWWVPCFAGSSTFS